MSVAVLSMSDGELRRLEVLRDVDRGGLPVGAAAQLLERSERQEWRLLKAFRAEGAPGLISKKRAIARLLRRSARRFCGSWARTTPISARRWPPRSSPESTALRSPARPCANG